VAEVVAFTRHLLDGANSFGGDTRPTLSEVETFIDRVSGVLNSAIAQAGISAPVTNSTASLACDNWVVAQAANLTEYTQRGVGFGDEEGSREITLSGLNRSAKMFVNDNLLGWKRLGVTVTAPESQGLTFTGLTTQADRADPDNTGRTQPRFERGKFDGEG
jgi:hypothetical protein